LCFYFKQKFVGGELFLANYKKKNPSGLAEKLSPFPAKKPKLEVARRKKNPPNYKLLRQVHGDCND